MSFHEDSFHQYIDSGFYEKLAMLRLLRTLDENIVDTYDSFASPNEKAWDSVRNDLDKIRKKIENKKWSSP
tara:strand:+ start:22 stop:234 length:213 start_codon:yes stop_codon:yes gene_type:complete